MDRKYRGERELDVTNGYWRYLHKAMDQEDKKCGRYGVWLHRILIRYVSYVLQAAGLRPTRKRAVDVTLLTYEIAECMWLSMETGKGYEIRTYINPEGLRFFQTSTIEAESPPPHGPYLLSIKLVAPHPLSG